MNLESPVETSTFYRDAYGRFTSKDRAVKTTTSAKKRLTLADVLNAIEQNGYEHIVEAWQRKNDAGKIVAGCAIGQGAANLHLNPLRLFGALNSIDLKGENGEGLGAYIVHLNDRQRLTIPQIVNQVRIRHSQNLDSPIRLGKKYV